MTKVQYAELLKKSYADFKQNPILFLPLLYGLIFLIIIGLIITAEYFLYLSLGLSISVEGNTLEIILLGGIFLIIDFILFLIALTVITTMYIGLFSDIINKKVVSASNLWQYVKQYLWLYLKITLLRILVIAVPLFVLGIITLVIFLISKTAALIVGGILLALFILFLLAAMIFMVFVFLFIGPIITTNKSQSAVEIMKESYNYSKSDTGHVVISWAILFGIGLVIQIPMQIISFLSNTAPDFEIIFMLLYVILFIASIILGIFLQLFLFNAYYNKNYMNKSDADSTPIAAANTIVTKVTKEKEVTKEKVKKKR